MSAERAGNRQVTVLIVDDDDDVREALQLALSKSGYATAGAADGRLALAWLRDNPLPDLVLLDLMMPVMDGWAVLDALTADPKLASIPVIVVTAFGRDLGTAARRPLLRKPVELRDLLRAVRENTQQPQQVS